MTCRNNGRRILNFEVMLTLACDMRCKYCFGKNGLSSPNSKNGEISEDVWQEVLSELDNIDSKPYFKGFDGVNVQLFGGEPSLAVDKIQELLKRYKSNARVIVKMVTNGQHLDELAPILLEYSSFNSLFLQEPKFYIQISYDGNPVHDIKRVSLDGSKTSEKVKAHIEFMQKNNLPYTMKSAITYDTFKYMHEAYLDFLDVSKGVIHYFPTIDQSESANMAALSFSEDYKKELIYELEKSLAKIAADEIRFARRISPKPYFPRFAWFEGNKSICSMGSGYFTVGIDGRIYPCHNTAYGSGVSEITNIFAEDKDEKIADAFDFFSKLKYNSHKCLECDASYCLKCPSEAYIHSQKNSDFSRYTDYGFNEFRCKAYRIASNMRQAINYYI